MGHRGERAEHDDRGGRVGRLVVYISCAAIILVMATGLVMSIVTGPDVGTTQYAVATPAEELAPSEDASTPAPSETTPPVLVDSACWKTRPAAERDDCQATVRDKTKFISRYQTNQSSLAKTHPVVKVEPTGRGANSLARHGLLTCWLIHEPRYSLDDVRSAFYLWFHRHKFTVPNDDTDGAADNVISIAVQEICPAEATALERKGGPKAELVQP